MKKLNKANGLEKQPIKNPVAKYAHFFNKSTIYANKRKYNRKLKHNGLESFSIIFI